MHWPVRLFGQHERASVESITENLSSEGLYCISIKPFKTGERLRCEIVIPDAQGLDAPIVLLEVVGRHTVSERRCLRRKVPAEVALTRAEAKGALRLRRNGVLDRPAACPAA